MNGSTHPPNRRPHDRPRPNLGGRPCKRVQIFDPLLVPLDPENERAALIALAVLLAPAGGSDASPDDGTAHGTGSTNGTGSTVRTEGNATTTNDNHDSADNGREGEADK